MIKKRYGDRQKQSAYENAYDCLYYGYEKSVWNNYELDEETSKEVWNQAFEDICSFD